MPFCNKCGTKYDEGTNFCPGCGIKLGGDTGAGPKANQNSENVGKNGNNAGNSGFEESFRKINNTPDRTNEFDKNDIDQNKGMAILSYIGFLVLIPIFAAKNSKYARYHSNQGLILFLCEIGVGIVEGIIGGIFGLIGLWFIGSIINLLLSLAVLALIILGLYNAATGKAKELPIIGKYKLLN